MTRNIGIMSLRAPARRMVKPASLARWVTFAIERVLTMLEIYRQRRALLALDDRLLSDIGISRADAEGEAARRYWDLPRHYL